MPRVCPRSLFILSYGECQDKSRPLTMSEGNFTSNSTSYLTLTTRTDKHWPTSQSIASMMRNTCQQGSTLQESRNGKDIGRRNSVHSTYGLMNNEHFFSRGFLYNFLGGFFLAIITFNLCRPPQHARRRQIPNCVLCFAFGRFWVVDLMLAGSIAGIDEVDRYISSSISPYLPQIPPTNAL